MMNFQLAILIFCAAMVSLIESKTVFADDRPNIVILLCDDLGYGDLECYGHPVIKTPNLNMMAANGLKLDSCYSAAPVCSPSRVGLLTGRSPNRAGVFDWIPSAGNKPRKDARDLVHMRKEEVTIPRLLKDAGYDTLMSGKWHCNSRFNSPRQPQPNDFGFDHWFGTQNNAAPNHANPTNFVRNGKPVGKLQGYSCQITMDEALNWLDSRKPETDPAEVNPFFMYIAFHEPHEPIASPQDLVEKYLPHAKSKKEADYFANVENVDLAVGKLFAKLEQLKINDNTLVIFTSDNGPETLNRYKNADRSFGRATPLRGMKLWTTDAGFRVAGIAHWPNKIKAGSQLDVPVSSLDFLPTFCNLAGTSPPTGLQLDGMDITEILGGGMVKRRKPLVWAYYNAINERRVAMRYGIWKVLAKLDSGKFPKTQNLYDANQADFKQAKLTDFQLFDASKDINESNNLWETDPSAGPGLKELLKSEYGKLVEDSHVWSR